MADTLQKLKFRFFGQKIPIVRYSENGSCIEVIDQVNLEPGGLIRDSWSGNGYELQPGIRPVKIIVGNRQRMGFAVSERGVAVNVEDRVKLHNKPIVQGTRDRAIDGSSEITLKFEGMIGALTAGNMIEKAIGLEPNDRALWIRLIIGILIGWLIVAPLVTQMV